MLRAEVTSTLVSASDVTPTDRWLNVWCIRHTKVETLQELRSHPVICWIIQDFRETCVSRSSTGNKDAVTPNPPHERRKLSCLQLWWQDQDQINAGFSKVCEIFIVHEIESLKHASLLLWRHFHALKRWTKQTVIGCWTCRSNGLVCGPWPIKANTHSRPSAVSLEVWLCETTLTRSDPRGQRMYWTGGLLWKLSRSNLHGLDVWHGGWLGESWRTCWWRMVNSGSQQDHRRVSQSQGGELKLKAFSH